GVAGVYVVGDQPGIRRRGDDPVERPAPDELTRVAVADEGFATAGAGAGERLDPGERVEGVPAQEVLGPLDRSALAAMLVAPVRLELRRAREVEVEMRRPA